MELNASEINRNLFKPLEKSSQHLLDKFEDEVAGFRSNRDSGGRLEMPEGGVLSNANTSLQKASDRSGGVQVELLRLCSVLMSMHLTMLATAKLERIGLYLHRHIGRVPYVQWSAQMLSGRVSVEETSPNYETPRRKEPFLASCSPVMRSQSYQTGSNAKHPTFPSTTVDNTNVGRTVTMMMR